MRDLPQPGVEPVPHALEVWSLKPCTSREKSPTKFFKSVVKLAGTVIRIHVKAAFLSGCVTLAHRPKVFLLNFNFYL